MHRKHASVYDVAQRLPHAAGALVLREVEVLKRLTDDPERPYVVVLGGSKVSDKLGVIEALLPRSRPAADRRRDVLHLPQGPGLRGRQEPRCEEDQVDTCGATSRRRRSGGVEIVLPVDIVVADGVRRGRRDTRWSTADAIPADRMGLDIGPVDARASSRPSSPTPRTVFWNGPMGVFELAPFAAGTRRSPRRSPVTKVDGFTVVGGGDSAAAVRQLGFDEDAFGHISTGGGASLEYLEGKELPGLAVLED